MYKDIKKPIYAWALFILHNKKKVKDKNPHFKGSQTFIELGRQWKDMSPSIREYYNEMEREDKERYIEELDNNEAKEKTVKYIVSLLDVDPYRLIKRDLDYLLELARNIEDKEQENNDIYIK